MDEEGFLATASVRFGRAVSSVGRTGMVSGFVKGGLVGGLGWVWIWRFGCVW